VGPGFNFLEREQPNRYGLVFDCSQCLNSRAVYVRPVSNWWIARDPRHTPLFILNKCDLARFTHWQALDVVDQDRTELGYAGASLQAIAVRSTGGDCGQVNGWLRPEALIRVEAARFRSVNR
jgi:hypothetical protein